MWDANHIAMNPHKQLVLSVGLLAILGVGCASAQDEESEASEGALDGRCEPSASGRATDATSCTVTDSDGFTHVRQNGLGTPVLASIKAGESVGTMERGSFGGNLQIALEGWVSSLNTSCNGAAVCAGEVTITDLDPTDLGEASGTNLRAAPQTNSRIIGVVNNGAKASVIAKDGSRLKVAVFGTVDKQMCEVDEAARSSGCPGGRAPGVEGQEPPLLEHGDEPCIVNDLDGFTYLREVSRDTAENRALASIKNGESVHPGEDQRGASSSNHRGWVNGWISSSLTSCGAAATCPTQVVIRDPNPTRLGAEVLGTNLRVDKEINSRIVGVVANGVTVSILSRAGSRLEVKLEGTVSNNRCR